MRARAGLFTLLICMMCLVGFGATTTDLDQNSTPDYEAFFDVDNSVSVDVVIDLSIDESKPITSDYLCFENDLETAFIPVIDVGKQPVWIENLHNTYNIPINPRFRNIQKKIDKEPNRFTKLFKEADLAFNYKYKKLFDAIDKLKMIQRRLYQNKNTMNTPNIYK